MTIYEYARLSEKEKGEVVKTQALFLEHYNNEGTIIYVYFLNGYFIEVTTKEGKTIDNLPYKRGHKFNKRNIHDIEKRNGVYALAA